MARPRTVVIESKSGSEKPEDAQSNPHCVQPGKVETWAGARSVRSVMTARTVTAIAAATAGGVATAAATVGVGGAGAAGAGGLLISKLMALVKHALHHSTSVTSLRRQTALAVVPQRSQRALGDRERGRWVRKPLS